MVFIPKGTPTINIRFNWLDTIFNIVIYKEVFNVKLSSIEIK